MLSNWHKLPVFGAEAAPAAAHRITLCAVVLLAFSLRAWNLYGQSLSMDEAVEVSIAKKSVVELIHRKDGFPPLYHIALKSWLSVCDSMHWPVEAGRWLSVFAGVVAVVSTIGLGKAIGGAQLGIAAGFLLAISPMHHYFSQEMRAYSLYVCAVTLALQCFLTAWNSNRLPAWTAFVVAASASVYTHYYATVVVALLAMLFLSFARVSAKAQTGLLAFVAVCLLSLPNVFLLMGDLSYQNEIGAQTPFNAITWAYTLYCSLVGFTLGPSLSSLHAMGTRDAIKQFMPWLCMLFPICAWLCFQAFATSLKLRRQHVMCIILLAILAVPLIGIAGKLAGVGYKVRYVGWSVVPVTLLLATALQARGPRRVTMLCFIALAGLQLAAIYNRVCVPKYANEDARSVSAYLAQTDAETPVFVVSQYMSIPMNHYLSDRDVLPLPVDEAPQRVFQCDATVAEALDQIRDCEHDGFWLVYSRPFHGDPDGIFLAALQKQSSLKLAGEFVGITLYRGHMR